jgi:hypothetical protein
MAASKIETVSNIDPKSINSLDKVRSFLGLCSYYRKFIRSFSILAYPLTRLTRTGCDVANESPTGECRDAIEALKKAITSKPVLIPPREDRRFIVKTDSASTLGIGAVLTQTDDDGRERVVAYYGRAFKQQRRIGQLPRYSCLRLSKRFAIGGRICEAENSSWSLTTRHYVGCIP